MRGRPRTWGYWTKAKLEILARYLKAFTTASKSQPERVYIDAFAGEGTLVERLTGQEFPGSARIALEVTDPPFTRLRYFERPRRARDLQQRLRADYPGRDVRVVGGDCNELMPAVLEELRGLRWAPTFAFLDPDGMELSWATLELLAAFRLRKYTKAELWMLFPSSGLLRALTLRDEPSVPIGAKATRLFGTDQWLEIYNARRAGVLDGEDAREGYVNLMRWRLERDLEYKWTHPLEIRNLRGVPIYSMIFATDHPAGTRIMSDLYTRAAKEIPAMREAILDELEGAPRLFGVEEDVPGYEYEEPWDPSTYLIDGA